MAIEYLEIRDENREIIGYIDTAISIIWHSVYYGVGDFEIHAQASGRHLFLLERGNYVTRPDDIEVGIIEKVEVTYNDQNGKVITATGRFAKSLLDRRIIYRLSGHSNNATVLRGNLETAIRNVVSANAINCTFDNKRNVPILQLGASAGIQTVIVDENGNPSQKQVSYDNLLKFTDELLQEYNLGSIVMLNDDTLKLEYCIYAGEDKSADNTSIYQPVIFSQEFDNLVDSDYSIDGKEEKNVALIGGEGEDIERFYSLIGGNNAGLSRKELFVDAKSQNKTLNEDDMQEMFPTGTFSGLDFIVGGVVYATLDVQNDSEYSLSSLTHKFPSGSKSGTNFIVGGVVYAKLIYGEDDKFNLTPLGYKAMLAVDQRKGNYTFTDAVYTTLLNTQGKQALAQLKVVEAFNGTINTTFGQFKLKSDYNVGDIVTIQDNSIGKYVNIRICEITEVQDEKGYMITPAFEIERPDEPAPLMLRVLTTENRINLLTENNNPIITENSLTTQSPNTSAEDGVKISELNEATDLNDLCCFPIVNNGETKRVTVATLKNEFSVAAITNETIDEICV